MRASQQSRARAFHALHQGSAPLVIGSVWDVASAMLFEQAGFAALGTSSAGIAYTHGHPDGQVITADQLIESVGRIAQAVSIPVSADIEAGFGHTPEQIAALCERVIAAGAVGINLEDAPGNTPGSLADADLQCATIGAIRQAARRCGLSLFINARTDGYWLGLWDASMRLAESIRRGNAYLAAGADCVFVPGALEPDTIAALVQGIKGPVNILAMPGCPDVASLGRLGVRRLSQGSGPVRAALGLTRRIARELIEAGTYTHFHQGAIAYPEANALFSAQQTSE